MATVRPAACASCGARVIWLWSYGFGDPRPVELAASPDGDVVVDLDESRYRYPLPGEPAASPRHRLHWPCGGGSPVPRSGSFDPGSDARPLSVGVVAHTHWDREWYETFEGFRARLVDVMDELLDVLDADPAFTSFHLDGQTAIVDDYLAVRPEATERVGRLVTAGRLAVGPWETLADEFLVSGETLVRNLQRGIRRSRELGRVSAVGYLPDQFGHTAQLPQILALAGLTTVAVYRGVPESVGATAFWWEAPDGTRVRAQQFPGGYCNGGRFNDDPHQLLERTRDLEAMLGSARVGALLVMNGCDHLAPQPWVPEVLARANELQHRYRFILGRLDDYLAEQPVVGLPVVRGELRDPGPATVTPGVLSSRMDVRLATAAAERAVERRAEPLCALFLSPARWPSGLLDRAWHQLVRDAAHDSICACSVDEVVRAVLLRADDARRIGDHLAAKAVETLRLEVDAPLGAVVVVNPTTRRRRGVVETVVPGRGPCHLVADDGSPQPVQVLAEWSDVELDMTAAAADLDALVDIVGPEHVGAHRIASWTEVDDSVPTFRLVIARDGEPGADVAAFAERLSAWRSAEVPVRLIVVHPPQQRLLASTGPVGGVGWHSHRVVDGEGPVTAVAGGPGWVANQHVRVEVDADDGTLTISTADGLRVSGLGRLVDGGDAGDLYNWSPPTTDTLVDTPSAVRIETLEHGPVRARLQVTRTYRWPVRVDHVDGASRRSGETVDVEVAMVVDVVVGEPFVRITVELDNRAHDHRLRIHLPLPSPVDGSDAESAFAVVHRGLGANGNAMEAPLPTFPSRRFVDCSDGTEGLAVVHDGSGEYEVVAGGRELAVTLLRAVGWLSRGDGANRPAHAGPPLAVADAQLLGPHRRRLAVVVHRDDWQAANLPAVADDLLVPLEAVPPVDGQGGKRRLPPRGSRLEVTGADVTAVYRRSDALEVRMVRLSPVAGRVEVALDGRRARGTVIDLDGVALGSFAGWSVLRPWQILTVRLDEQ